MSEPREAANIIVLSGEEYVRYHRRISGCYIAVTKAGFCRRWLTRQANTPPLAMQDRPESITSSRKTVDAWG